MDKAVTPFSNAGTSNSHRLIGIIPPLLVISIKNGGLNNASAGEFVNTAYAYALFVLGNKRSWRKSKLDYLVLGYKDSIVIDPIRTRIISPFLHSDGHHFTSCISQYSQ